MRQNAFADCLRIITKLLYLFYGLELWICTVCFKLKLFNKTCFCCLVFYLVFFSGILRWMPPSEPLALPNFWNLPTAPNGQNSTGVLSGKSLCQQKTLFTSKNINIWHRRSLTMKCEEKAKILSFIFDPSSTIIHSVSWLSSHGTPNPLLTNSLSFSYLQVFKAPRKPNL